MITLLLAVIYLAFIGLGLPDGVLGAAWPLIAPEFSVPLSHMGLVNMIISAGTILSSLGSHRIIQKIGVPWVCGISVGMTALALWGYGSSHTFAMLCLWSIPYGLGAGSIDAALNNYVALHFESKHMSWLHCMWGVGASLGPYIMSALLLGGNHWGQGYWVLSGVQWVLTGIIFLSIPLWKQKTPSLKENTGETLQNAPPTEQETSLRNLVKLPGGKEIMVAFFCYCAIEQTTGIWASSYLVYHRGMGPEQAARLTALYYLGITLGRGICGFITMKASDIQMIRGGFWGIAMGVVTLCLPLGEASAYVGLIAVGLGCAPIYPSIIHSIPTHFGASRSQGMTGLLMASAYTGSLAMPFFFGFLANVGLVGGYPLYLALLLAVMVGSFGRMLGRVSPGTQ